MAPFASVNIWAAGNQNFNTPSPLPKAIHEANKEELCVYVSRLETEIKNSSITVGEKNEKCSLLGMGYYFLYRHYKFEENDIKGAKEYLAQSKIQLEKANYSNEDKSMSFAFYKDSLGMLYQGLAEESEEKEKEKFIELSLTNYKASLEILKYIYSRNNKATIKQHVSDLAHNVGQLLIYVTGKLEEGFEYFKISANYRTEQRNQPIFTNNLLYCTEKIVESKLISPASGPAGDNRVSIGCSGNTGPIGPPSGISSAESNSNWNSLGGSTVTGDSKNTAAHYNWNWVTGLSGETSRATNDKFINQDKAAEILQNGNSQQPHSKDHQNSIADFTEQMALINKPWNNNGTSNSCELLGQDNFTACKQEPFFQNNALSSMISKAAFYGVVYAVIPEAIADILQLYDKGNKQNAEYIKSVINIFLMALSGTWLSSSASWLTSAALRYLGYSASSAKFVADSTAIAINIVRSFNLTGVSTIIVCYLAGELGARVEKRLVRLFTGINSAEVSLQDKVVGKFDKNKLLSWNCFDVAIGLSDLLEIKETNHPAREEQARHVIVERALKFSDDISYRKMLASEIKAAAVITAVYKNLSAADLKESKELEEKSCKRIAELLDIVGALNGAEEQKIYFNMVMKELEKMHGQRNTKDAGDLPLFSLPQSMHGDAQEYFNNYELASTKLDAVQREINNEVQKKEGHRIGGAEQLRKFFSDQKSQQQYPDSYRKFNTEYESCIKQTKAFQAYCESKGAYEAYVREYYGGNNWFAFQPAIGGTSMVDITATLLGCRIVIYNTSGAEIYKTNNNNIEKGVKEITFNGVNHFTVYKNADQEIQQSKIVVNLSAETTNANNKKQSELSIASTLSTPAITTSLTGASAACFWSPSQTARALSSSSSSSVSLPETRTSESAITEPTQSPLGQGHQ